MRLRQNLRPKSGAEPKAFEKETGVGISHVYVNMVDVTLAGGSSRSFLLGSVEVDAEIR